MRAQTTPIPESARRALGAAGYRRLERAAAAILPRGGPLAPGAADLDVALSVARSLAGLPRLLRLAFRGLLAAWELAPLASRFRRPFSRLGEAERTAFAVEAAGRAGLQGVLLGLKIPCIAHYTAHPRVSEILGFDDRCIDGSPPRPGPRLKPIVHPEIAGDVSVRADVVVIGSGAGGAVVAKELAERGISVIVVEEGAYFAQEDFRGSLPDRFQKFYRDGGTTLALGRPFVSVPLGKAVGGTTVVNSGTCFRAPDRVLREWESRWGIEGASPDALGKIFERVERTMHVKPVPEELLGENARVFRRGAEALGMHGAPIPRNIDGCRGCGVCAFGCPSDAKQAMHLSYLPRAEAAGARIYARCRVRRILRRSGRAAGVEAEILGDAPRSGEPDAIQGRLTVQADRVVLAAGAVHTPVLLMASGLAPRGGPVGRHLRIHPALSVSAIFDEDIFGWRGTMQPFFMDDFQESHGLLFEVTSPLPGISAVGLPGAGAALKDALAAYRKVASVGMFVAESSEGRVRRTPGGGVLLTYSLNVEDTRRLLHGIGIAARIFFAAGARQVNPGIAGLDAIKDPSEVPRITEGGWKASALTLAGFHPVGTAAMGRDREHCAVDPWGESYALPGLHVADASVFPSCIGVNPQVTIMAMATRIAWRLAEGLGAHRAPPEAAA
jgi:choline dehydrogenase-like flavoprotein